MSGGLIMLLIIALFFLSMYLYAYGTTNYHIRKEQRARELKLKKAEEAEQRLKAEMEEKQKAREEKYRLANERSEEIRREIARLEQLKHNA